MRQRVVRRQSIEARHHSSHHSQQHNQRTSISQLSSKQALHYRICSCVGYCLVIMAATFGLLIVVAALYIQRIRGVINPERLSTPIRDPELSPDKIALLHMVDNVWFFQELAEVTLRNKRRYARRHNFEVVTHTPHETSGLWKEVASCEAVAGAKRRSDGKCYVPNNSNFELDKRAPTFGKIKLAISACEGRDNYWLLWSDADAMIVNQTKSLLDVVDDGYDILVSKDWFMINAGVLLFRCSPWNIKFLNRVYDAREFDKANALDQSAFNNFFETDAEVRKHVKYVPKWLINVYTEEYRAGDFIVHFAGKLYEATPEGITAIARQFDVLSRIDEAEKVAAFFDTQYMLNYFSGTCVMGAPEKDPNRECRPDDARRMKLPEPLKAFSTPNRYRQLEYRSPGHAGWKDPHDVPGATDIKIRRVKVEAPKS